MKQYAYFQKKDPKREPIFKGQFKNRKGAAQWFANLKRLSLRDFLTIFSVSEND